MELTQKTESATPSCLLSDQDRKSILTIDLKKKRLRLYKHALNAIGNPEYILLLVSPKTHKLVIMRSTEKEKCSIRIYWTVLNDKGQCCEFYSKELLEMMKQFFFPHDRECTYRVYGSTKWYRGMILFDLNECVELEDMEA